MLGRLFYFSDFPGDTLTFIYDNGRDKQLKQKRASMGDVCDVFPLMQRYRGLQTPDCSGCPTMWHSSSSASTA